MRKKSKEDYLRLIYSMSLSEKESSDKERDRGPIRPIDISKSLNVSKPTVTKMIKKLNNEGYVKWEAYSKVSLTRKGITEARKITEKYDVIITFLKKIGYKDKEKTICEAHKLEHAFSDESIGLIRDFFGCKKSHKEGKE